MAHFALVYHSFLSLAVLSKKNIHAHAEVHLRLNTVIHTCAYPQSLTIHTSGTYYTLIRNYMLYESVFILSAPDACILANAFLDSFGEENMQGRERAK